MKYLLGLFAILILLSACTQEQANDPHINAPTNPCKTLNWSDPQMWHGECYSGAKIHDGKLWLIDSYEGEHEFPDGDYNYYHLTLNNLSLEKINYCVSERSEQYYGRVVYQQCFADTRRVFRLALMMIKYSALNYSMDDFPETLLQSVIENSGSPHEYEQILSGELVDPEDMPRIQCEAYVKDGTPHGLGTLEMQKDCDNLTIYLGNIKDGVFVPLPHMTIHFE